MLRKMFNRLVLALLPLTLMACAATPGSGPSPQSVFAGTCTAYTGALTAITPLKASGKLSPGQIATVNTINATVTPLCEGPLPSNPTQELTSLNNALAALAAIKAKPGA